MVYTSYFGNLKNIDLNKYLVATICCYRPKGLDIRLEDWGFLAPDPDLLEHWKTYHDTDYYFEFYMGKLAKYEDYIINEFNKIKDRDVVVLCYEKPSDFCHRHLLTMFLDKHGIPCGGELGDDKNATSK